MAPAFRTAKGNQARAKKSEFRNFWPGAGLYFAKIHINSNEYILSSTGIPQLNTNAGQSCNTKNGLAKSLADCTLQISAGGYISKQISLTSTVAAAGTIKLSIPNAQDIVINGPDIHQTMDGFGACCRNLSSMTDSVADLFFSPTKGVGLSILRASIDPSGSITGGYAVAQKAVARGVIVWAAPWTPPANYKDNNDENNGGHLLTQYYGAWATSLANLAATSKQNGVPLYGISVQNEPDYTASYNSCLYSNQEMIQFIDTLGPKLAGLTPRPKIIMPEVSSWNNTWGYSDAAIADVQAAKYTDILATHQYFVTDPTPHAIPTGKQFWETENSSFDGPSTDITNGIMVATWIHNAIVDGGVSAWHYWWLISSNNDNEGILNSGGIITKRLYTMGNFSKFVRPGYRRMGTAGGPGGVMITAYKDPASTAFAIVAINNNGSNGAVHIVLNGITTPAVTPWVTSASLNLAAQPVVTVNAGSLNASLPATSVTTFVGQ